MDVRATAAVSGSGDPHPRARGLGANWYRGDCHVHSSYSDGELAPERLAADARAAGLDFVATTEHNTVRAHSVWERLASDDFLVLMGEEVTTKTGHWLALGIASGQLIEWDYGVGDNLIDQGLRQVRDSGGLCAAAHPHAPYPSDSFMYPYEGLDAIEVWNGLWKSDRPWNADNEAALADWGRALAEGIRTGHWRPAIGNSDAHLEGQIGVPHTVVLAEELSTASILDGLRAGRSWIAEASTVDLSLTATAAGRVAGIGEHLAAQGESVMVRAHLRGVPQAVVSFHTDLGEVHRTALSGSGVGTVEWQTRAEDSAFVRVEVRHLHGGMAALTNPIVLA
ncbi:CehA/McbA family metallohydrolase [Streptomyces sp. NPDC005385]|uniref:CehA/McbA family metallohydrolase n=1 Tax=Streptomyces sp. NPDC005385 TaxID=3157039 RepID=UPI0033A38F04